MMMKTSYATALMIPLLAGTLFGQAPKKQALLMAMSANGKQMMAYQWKQKVTVVRKGNPLDPIIEELRFDGSGQLQHTTLVKPEERKMGPLRARKAAEIKEDVQQVMHLARRYASPQQLSQAIQKGEIWEGSGSIRIQARSLVLPMDEVTIVANSSNYLAAKLDCRTAHEGSPVSIEILYQQLPHGPTVMSRMIVRIPGDDIVVNVDSYDFIRLARPMAAGL